MSKNKEQYLNFDEYIRQGEPQKKERAEAWSVAIGLQAVDGLKTSEYLQQTARRNIEGEITIDEARELVKEYRSLSGNYELPIVIMQLPMFIERKTQDIRDWAYLRQAQERVAIDIDGVELVSIIDTGEYDNVHPVNKKTPGTRLAKNILSKIYCEKDKGGEDMYIKASQIQGNRVVLTFANTYGGIVTGDNELKDFREEERLLSDKHSFDAEHLYGFELFLSNGEIRLPDVIIEGDTLSLELTDNVDSISYAFFNYGKVNVYNKRGMPLRPFKIKL